MIQLCLIPRSERRIGLSWILSLLTCSIAFGEAGCPGKIEPLRYQSLTHAQIVIPVTVNGSGPYEFMVDTGAQVTIVDPPLANQLGLMPSGSVGVIAVTNYARVPLVSAADIEAGPVAVHGLQIAVEALGELQQQNPKLRGILGGNFLNRFDLLIDQSHKVLCFDDSHWLWQSLGGERVPVLSGADPGASLAYSQPVLISAHLRGDGPRGTVLRVDSGASAPLLFANQRLDILPWLQKSRMMRGVTAGNPASAYYAIAPTRDVMLSEHRQIGIAFLTPIGAGGKAAETREDGLLPTALFKRVFISPTDRFVMFDPLELCPQ